MLVGIPEHRCYSDQMTKLPKTTLDMAPDFSLRVAVEVDTPDGPKTAGYIFGLGSVLMSAIDKSGAISLIDLANFLDDMSALARKRADTSSAIALDKTVSSVLDHLKNRD
jgi:hypothetical protein